MRRYGVIIAARTGSSRLPGKALLPLAGIPMIVFLLRRLKSTQRAERIALATTTLPEDDALAELFAKEETPVFRGNREDVVNRFVQAAASYDMEYVVRVTGDCPFVDGTSLDHCLAQCDRAEKFDIATTKGRFPVGIDYEIYRAEAMAQLDREDLTSDEREHLTLPMYNRPDRFSRLQLTAPGQWPLAEQPLTVDTPEDYRFAAALADMMPSIKTDIAAVLTLSTQLSSAGKP